jgi:hypothetical protein
LSVLKIRSTHSTGVSLMVSRCISGDSGGS